MKEESEALAKDDKVLSLTRSFVDDIAEWTEKEKAAYLLWRRPVLVLDTYEWLAPLIDVWLRTQLLAQDLFAKADAALLIAGRDHLLKTDTRWSEWQHLTTNIELAPLSKEAAKAYLKSLKVSQDSIDELYEITQGSPLFLSLVAQIKEPDQAFSILSQRILEEVPQAQRADFLRASVLDNFDPISLASIFPDRDTTELDQLLSSLKRASFTLESQGSRGFIPSVRAILRRNLAIDLGPDAYAELEKAARQA